MTETNFLNKSQLAKELNTNRSALGHVCEFLGIEWQQAEGTKKYYLLPEDEAKVRAFYAEHPYPKAYFSELTCMERYGVKNVLLVPETRQAAMENSHTKEATAKQRATAKENWLEKYGVPYNPSSMAALHSEEAAENRRATCLERYGVDNPFKIPGKVANAKRKLKESMTSEEWEARFQHVVDLKRQRYGRSMCNIEKHLKAMQDKYGCDSPNQVPSIVKKQRQKYHYNGETFDSSWELAFYYYHVSQNMFITRDVEPLSYEYNGVVHRYFPDFKTDAGIIEIKGSHLLPSNCKLGNKGLTQAKFKCMEANSVIVITDVSVYIKYCNEHNFNLMEYKRDYNET